MRAEHRNALERAPTAANDKDGETSMTDPVTPPSTGRSDASVGELVAQLADQTTTLVRDEMQLAKVEMVASVKAAGIGAGLFSVAGLIALYGLGALIATAILALALVVDAWLAALIVTAVLFVIAAIAALIGKSQVSKVQTKPEAAIGEARATIDDVKEARRG